MKDQFQRLLHLAKTTGDRLIVTDAEGENAFVVMDIDQYEALIYADDFCAEDEWDLEDLDATEVLEEEEGKDTQNKPTIWETMHAEGQGGEETWDLDGLSEEEMVDLEKQFQEFILENGVNSQEKQEERAENEEEQDQMRSEVVSDEETGEEQFYLEPIE